uniref:Ankyrin repeat protein n=1 Tax=Colletotrichum fructicola (strain Nara gc5) TaxID=1213859 RepID=L2G4U6_COLFN
MEALRAAIAAAQSAGTLLLATFRPYREKDFVWKRLSELKDFSKICDRIELDPVLGRDCDIEANLKRCADNVSDLKVLLEEATSFDQDHRFRGSWKSLVGEDIDEEFVRLFNRLQRERAALELRIENATSYAEYQMGVAAREAKPRAAASSANWLRSAIFITDPRNDRSALISAKGKRADGTCTWILETDAYSTWMHTPCPGLWITGGPGIGKSIMSIFLTEQLELKVEGPTKESVIYFFCDGQNDARDNAPVILQALIWQLGRLKPYLIQHAIPQVQSHFGMKVYSTRIESLCRTFISMVEDPDAGCVFCVIDGLDECDSTSSELVNCLLGVTTPRFKPIIISRPLNQSLTSSLSEYVRLRLDTDFEKQVKTDLSAFIQQRVQQLSDDGDFLPALRHVLHDKFMKRSEGTFLWVGLAAQELENTQLAEVETSLSSLPSGLNGIYNQVLRSIDPACATSVARLLTVVMTAYIPLSIEDAESLLGIQPTDDLTASEVMESLIAQCGSLLTLLGEPKSRKRVIRLVHQSVKDYLFRPSKDADHELEALRFQQQKAHLQLASLCLDILESFKFREGRPEDIQKFRETGFRAQYALDCFENHAKDSGSEFSSLVLRSLPFLKPLIYASDEDDKTDWGCLMHNASQFGILPVVRHALDKPLGLYKSVRGYTRGTTPLHIAALSEYGETVRALLQKQRYLPGKWSVSAKDWAGETPLHVAAVRSPTSSVQALLDYKANPNLPNCQGHTALHKAVYSDHSEIPRLISFTAPTVTASVNLTLIQYSSNCSKQVRT